MSFRLFSSHMEVDGLTLRSLINVHLLSLLDGLPHEKPIQKVIALDSTLYWNPVVTSIQISGSRIALVIWTGSFVLEGGCGGDLIAWDWKTGEVISDFSSLGTDFNRTLTQVLEYSS